MTCESEIENNIACINCKIKSLIRQGADGEYIDKDKVSPASIIKKPRDAWSSRPARRVVLCDRGLGIQVK